MYRRQTSFKRNKPEKKLFYLTLCRNDVRNDSS